MARSRSLLVLFLSAAAALIAGPRGAAPAARASPAETAQAPPTVLASIRLYNPTLWTGPAAIELPVGSLATPGAIDWTRARLLADDGSEVPFAIREGLPHWKAQLTAPVTKPRAEDLLVFSRAAPHAAWTRIDVVAGSPRQETALNEQGEQLVVSYAGFKVAIQRATGMLSQITAYGEPLLDAPLAMSFYHLSADRGGRQALGAPHVRLFSNSSSAALSELHFVLDSGDGLSMALTYRIHACGLVEILADERPWHGTSPWVDHAVDIALRLGGSRELLPELLNRAPYYGFKDYAAAVKHAAAVYRRSRAAVLELGEETTNGRRWNRRLYLVRGAQAAAMQNLVDVADKGIIIEPAPAGVPVPGRRMRIAYRADVRVAAQLLAEALRKRGVEVQTRAGDADDAEAGVAFKVVTGSEAAGIADDGFEIRRRPSGSGVLIAARTPFGLMQAALRAAEWLARSNDAVRLPLIAGNPAVRLRGGGFGGGDFEVDFPYGSEAEWEAALDELVAGGMNVMADLGMWSNWKMPVSYRYMPELRSTAKDAYDEVSGAKLAEFEAHRDRGLRLLHFLHDRGVKVWLWLPVGCVPTTYSQAHPEAMAPGNNRCPCFTHSLYNAYFDAFLKEVLETYAIDGIVMIRDDNGGLCPCGRCKDFVGRSRTKSAAWEQYLILYRLLRAKGFTGDIGVYPYFDGYEPRLDPLLPADLFIVGHGSGAGMLARNYETLAPMGDTWLDNVFASFRVPTAARMRRLVADRNSFWIGGALCGSELPWQSVGRFGWEPTTAVNTLRYEWGRRRLGVQNAIAFVDLADAYEQLWEIYDVAMLPETWLKLSAATRQKTAARGHACLAQFRARFAVLQKAVGDAGHDAWFRHLGLFATYFEYHLGRLQRFAQMRDLVAQNRQVAEKPEGLPEALRRQLLTLHRQVYELSEAYDREAATVPGNMLARTRANQMTRPFQEWAGGGYDPQLDNQLDVKQFAGSIAVAPQDVPAGRPFVLRIELQNRGVCPWIADVGHRLELRGEAARLGLPSQWKFEGPDMVFGDRRTISLRGVAPQQAGETQVHLAFCAPLRNPYAFLQTDVRLRWK